jgi:hypothetical protein
MLTTFLELLAFNLVTAFAAYFYGTAVEWSVHRYLFHGFGKQKGSVFRFHWSDHHKAAHKTEGSDPAYEGTVFQWNAYGREFWFILLGIIIHIPVAFVSPAAWVAIAITGLNYHYLHRKSHLDPQWCKETLPWHWDHHMGNAATGEANWCITCEWFDKLMGTRLPYVPKESRVMEPAAAE